MREVQQGYALEHQFFDPDDLGTHSFRKGAGSYLGQCGSASGYIATCLRMGWKIGEVQNRYFVQLEGGDQLVGRAVCGLPRNDVRYATPPPHFVDVRDDMVQNAVNHCFPQFITHANVLGDMRAVLTRVLASVVYHQTYLIELYAGQTHVPLFNT